MRVRLKLHWVLPIVAFLAASLLFAGVTQNVSALPKMTISVKVDKDPITVGNNQSIFVTVKSRDKTIGDVSVSAEVVYASGFTRSFSGTTDSTGSWGFSWYIGAATKAGTFVVKVTASKTGYEAGTGGATFTVKEYSPPGSSTPEKPSPTPKEPKTKTSQKIECKGKAQCITGTINKIIDGDTLKIGKYTVRLSLTDTPEKDQPGFKQATTFTKNLCRVGSKATVDQDDKQPKDTYDRILGKVICSGKILNAELLYNGHAKILKKFCSNSEFASEDWAKVFGC